MRFRYVLKTDISERTAERKVEWFFVAYLRSMNKCVNNVLFLSVRCVAWGDDAWHGATCDKCKTTSRSTARHHPSTGQPGTPLEGYRRIPPASSVSSPPSASPAVYASG